MSKPIIVILTGAGISAESGISTFRDANGLWENHDIHDVASPEGWHKNPQLVLDFYNQRRAQLNIVTPNFGHKSLVALEDKYDVHIITQNVDDLHERAGSSSVLHLHGELRKVRSVKDATLIQYTEQAINIGDLAQDGGQLRPHIVWFGEEVPVLEMAANLASTADIFIVVGTSMQVYPADSLINYAAESAEKYYLDVAPAKIAGVHNLQIISAPATTAVPELVAKLLSE
jgi:NAD-dependent deacetylase